MSYSWVAEQLYLNLLWPIEHGPKTSFQKKQPADGQVREASETESKIEQLKR
jgi:hypothetical protein